MIPLKINAAKALHWIYGSPWRIFLTLWWLIFLTEFFIMLVLSSAHFEGTPIIIALLDSALLGLVVSIFLWLLIVKPLSGETAKFRELAVNIINETRDGVIVVGEDQTVLMANTAASRIFGVKGDQLRNLAIAEILPLFPVCTESGSLAWSQKLPVDMFADIDCHKVSFGTKWFWAVFIRDVTEAKQEQLTKETEKEKHAAAQRLMILGEMAGAIAHELSTPLAAMQLQLELLKREIEGKSPNSRTMSGMINAVFATYKRLVRIIQGVKTVIRGGHAHAVSFVDVQKVLDGALAVYKDLSGRRAGFLNCELLVERTEEKLMIFCDEVQINQVILNLFNNALDALENLERRWIKVELKGTDEWVELAVSDSGRISEDIKSKLFEMLFTTKPPEKGTGLGLNLSRKIITAHGGTINLDERSENTRFVVRLPRRAHASSSLPSEPAESRGSDQAQIEEWLAGHRRWRTEFVDSIERGGEISDEKIRKIGLPEQCELGQWIKEARPRMAGDEVFTELDGLHRKLHVLAVEIAQAIKKGNRSEAIRMISGTAEFTVLTLSITQLIERLRKRI